MVSPLMNFLNLLELSKEKVLPKSFGFLHKNNHAEMNLRSFYLKKEYVHPFVKSVQLSTQLEILDLASCQIDTEICVQLSENIPYNLLTLNLTKNTKIGSRGIESLCKNVLSDSSFKL